MKRITLWSFVLMMALISWNINAQDDCSQEQVSNDFENGLFDEEGGQQIANDIIVSQNNTNFSLETIIVNELTMGGIASFDIKIYEDADGLPGDQMGETIEDLAPTSSENIGTAFGYDVEEITLDLPTPIDLAGNGEDAVTYWVQLIATPNNPAGAPDFNASGMEVTTVGVIGEPLVFDSPDNEGLQWTPTSDLSDGVISFFGSCTYVDCTSPEVLAAENIDITSVDLTWNEVGDATEWTVIYGEEGFDPTNDGQTLVDDDGTPGVSLTGLETNTAYDFYVKSTCSADEESVLSGPLTFTTLAVPPENDNLCDAIALEINEESAGDDYTNTAATAQTDEPAGSCWFFGDAAQTTVWFTFVAPESGNATVSTDIEGGTLTDTQLAVYEAASDCTDLTTLGAEVGCDEDGGEVVALASVVTLTGLTPGDTYYAQVDGYNGGVGDFGIKVSDAGCLAPTNIEVNETGLNMATVSWTPAGPSTEWEVVYGTTGFNPESEGENVTVSDDPETTLTDLNPDTEYDVYIQTICSDDQISEFSGVVQFFTEADCNLLTEVFTEGFENNRIPGCWSVINNDGQNNTWEYYNVNDGAYQPRTGEGAARLSYETDAHDDYLISPQFSVIDGSTNQVLFFAGGTGGTFPETFDVKVSTTGNSVADFTETIASETTSADTENGEYDEFLYDLSAFDGEDIYVAIVGTSTNQFHLLVDDFSVGTTASTGLETFQSFSFYPNPVQNSVNLSAQSQIDRVVIHNMLGQKVKERESNKTDLQLNVAEFASGVYFMNVTIDGNQKTFKLVKE